MTETYDRTLAFVRLLAVYALVGAMLALARPVSAQVYAGAVLVAAGEWVRLWAAGHLVKNEILVTSGPYRHVRNPLYLGRLLIFSGLSVAARLPYAANFAVLAAGWLIFFGYYLPRKERVEPERLGSLHGNAFEEYRREVPSLVPTIRAWPGGSPAKWSLLRAWRNREHWMVIALGTVFAFLLWRAG